METKHTQGEWEVVHEMNVMSKNGDYVCSCGGQRGNMTPEKQTEMNISNAKLIAAAPELLNIVKKINAIQGRGWRKLDKETLGYQWAIDMEKAIKKATL